MRCTRCDGLMVVEDCVDIKGNKDEFWIKAMRCVACGNILDPMIAYHRAHGLADVVSLNRKPNRRAPRTPVARLSA